MTRKIISRHAIQEIYIGQNGKETPVTEMVNPHLVSAYRCAVLEEKFDPSVRETLEKEILRRMKH